jgi:hypothetical protein
VFLQRERQLLLYHKPAFAAGLLYSLYLYYRPEQCIQQP